MTIATTPLTTDRAELLARLAQPETYDLLIIGGGATGLGTAVDAAARGFKVALVTDGRLSGASGKILAAIHVTPEASLDGPLCRVVDGDLVPLPPKPAPFMTFDAEAGAWVDPRTDADRASEHDARRSAASMTKGEFLQACIANMMLNPKEASIAARGDIPEPFQAAVALMTPEQQYDLRVIWPVTTRVCRMDPLLLAVAEARGITDDTLDALFGLT